MKEKIPLASASENQDDCFSLIYFILRSKKFEIFKREYLEILFERQIKHSPVRCNVYDDLFDRPWNLTLRNSREEYSSWK